MVRGLLVWGGCGRSGSSPAQLCSWVRSAVRHFGWARLRVKIESLVGFLDPSCGCLLELLAPK